MAPKEKQGFFDSLPRLSEWSHPEKVLVTMIVIMMAMGLGGALGQIIVHDIIPTFRGEKMPKEIEIDEHGKNKFTRGDIFATASPLPEIKPFYQTDEFIFVLKFVHIHLFGMSLIFIFIGGIVLFLDIAPRVRAGLIVLPFIGVIIDLASVWLKVFIHPYFFWMHIPGGALFGAVFGIDSVLILWQLWGKTKANEIG